MAAADQPLAPPDDTPTHLPEELPDRFSVVAPRDTPKLSSPAQYNETGLQSARTSTTRFSTERAEWVLDALRDDEEAAIDLASFVFDADVRRALAT